jgi:hypothetical protein
MATSIFTHFGTNPEFKKRVGIQAFAKENAQTVLLAKSRRFSDIPKASFKTSPVIFRPFFDQRSHLWLNSVAKYSTH